MYDPKKGYVLKTIFVIQIHVCIAVFAYRVRRVNFIVDANRIRVENIVAMWKIYVN